MHKHFLISRTDAIGDVVLTLPMCGWLKSCFPAARISFLGRTYTAPVIACCSAVDEFINADELWALPEEEQAGFIRNTNADTIIHVFPSKRIARLARRAGISARIGTTNRWYHWLYCNKLVALSRRKSELHEAELNIRLLKGLGQSDFPSLTQLPGYYDFSARRTLTGEQAALLNTGRFNLIIHPKSNGSGAEWPLERWEELIRLLPADRFRIFISGSAAEKKSLSGWTGSLPAEKVTDISGMMDLGQLITFFSVSGGLIASGTGPLHLAAATGIRTLGIFPASKPINAARWAPLGKNALSISSQTDSPADLSAGAIYERIKSWAE